MQGILLRTLITMLGLYFASLLVPGVQIAGTGSFILAAVLIGLVNAFVPQLISLISTGLTSG